ncbi:MAG: AAA family ATPase [Candidatus Aenigmatarchaeota archaeon]
MEVPSWYVITGEPSSGKTTILKKLEELGYFVVPETARILIDKYIKKRYTSTKIKKKRKSISKTSFKVEIKN